MIDRFKEGKWYCYIGKTLSIGWVQDMKFMLDGKPHKCISTSWKNMIEGDEPGAAANFEDAPRDSSDLERGWDFSGDLGAFEEVPTPDVKGKEKKGMKNFVKVNTKGEFRTLMAAFDAAEIRWLGGEKATEWEPWREPPFYVCYNTDRGHLGWQENGERHLIRDEKETTMARFLKKLEIVKLKKELALLPKDGAEKKAPATFFLGQRVKHEKHGKGTIVYCLSNSGYAVAFDKANPGHLHDLEGGSFNCPVKIRKEFGYWCNPESLTALN